MKHIIYIILSAALIVACSGNGSPFGYDKDDIVPVTPVTPEISVSVYELDFAAAGETKTITLTSNVSWRLEDSPQWITSVSPSQGSGNAVISINAAENTSTTERTSILSFVTTDGTRRTAQITVRQSAAVTPEPTPTLNVATTTLTFSADDTAPQTISIEGNDDWTFTVSYTNGNGWCTVSPAFGKAPGSISVSVAANTNTQQRKATINIIGAKTRTFTVEVTQEGKTPLPTLSVKEKTLHFTAQQAQQDITIEGNDSWTASVTKGSDWCSIVSSREGTAPATITVQARNNTDKKERTAEITIKGTVSGESITVTVTQDGKTDDPVEASISADPTSLTFESDQTTRQHVNVTSTKDWSILDADKLPLWCHIESKTSSGFYVRLDQNTIISSRTAVITLVCEDKTCTVTVIQKAASIGRNEYEDD